MNAKVITRKSIDTKPLILKKTLDVIGGKWRLYIIYQLGTKVRRYGELRRMIPLVSEKVLIQELKVLINLGVVEKKSYKEIPPRVEYCLTVRGKQALPILLKLAKVGEIFLGPESDQ